MICWSSQLLLLKMFALDFFNINLLNKKWVSNAGHCCPLTFDLDKDGVANAPEMVVGHADVLSSILLRHFQDLQSLVGVFKLDFACGQVAALLEPLDGGGRPEEGKGPGQSCLAAVSPAHPNSRRKVSVKPWGGGDLDKGLIGHVIRIYSQKQPLIFISVTAGGWEYGVERMDLHTWGQIVVVGILIRFLLKW